MPKFLGFALVLLLSFSCPLAFGQARIDHWETVVNADDTWSYRVGTSAPPANWMMPEFDSSSWNTGQGGIGYGDGDDNTIIPPTLSVCLRISFQLLDTSVIKMALLHADYDDAFVAYLNGLEIGRGNIDIGAPTLAFDESPNIYQEAKLYMGEQPEAYPIYQDSFNALVQEGENLLAIQVNNYSIQSSDLSSNFFFSLGISDTSFNYGATPEWFSEPFIESNLPLIQINSSDEVIADDSRITAYMKIVDNGLGQLNNIDDPSTDYNGQISIGIRGNSSQMYDKKSYGLETQTHEGENNNVSLLRMPAENDWVLYGPYSDKSLIRNALTYELGRDAMEYAPRARYCELLINDEYKGIYILTEKIKRDKFRVDIATLKPDDLSGDELTGGYIIKIDWDDIDGNEDGWYSSYGSYPFYAYHHPGHDQLMPEQKTYIKDWMLDFEMAMTLPGYDTTYQDYIDIPSFVDYFLINEFAKHIDAFKLSFYMYKRKGSNGGKLHMGPIWDINLGFNNFDFGCDPRPQGWIHPCVSRAFWLSKILEIDEVGDYTFCRWQQLREGSFSNDAIINRIDSLVELMGPAIERNFEQYDILGEYVWPNVYIGETHEEEIDFLKEWIHYRLIWMDLNMIGNSEANCNEILPSQDLVFQNEIRVFPNPTKDQVTFYIPEDISIEGDIVIYNLTGKMLHKFKPSDRLVYNMSSLANGVYLYEYRLGDQVISRGKLIKQD